MLQIKNVFKSYNHHNKSSLILDGISLTVSKGEFISIFGPNGCGKTTLFNLIAELEKPDKGQITWQRPKKIAFIVQDYRGSLFPWLTIIDNIAYPLKLRGITTKQRHATVKKLCQQFRIEINLASYPYTLSGGQQQLVVILRALISSPDIILMDEPFASLDYQTTLLMEMKIQEIWQETGVTIIFVSHEIDESILLSQRLILFSHKPTKIIKEIINPLAYPRPIRFLGTPEFANLKQETLNLFIKEVGYDYELRNS